MNIPICTFIKGLCYKKEQVEELVPDLTERKQNFNRIENPIIKGNVYYYCKKAISKPLVKI